ncbi:MAG: Glu-tRNA(Gln) amidotransferase subunit GatE [Nanoarchaeota archaeon]|nr:Glu-tRNA(Gln) amidotransferase subunit GatE [Nanoarchaeota archaeon]
MEELKAGLEIHQQLDTGKLFCRCPGFLRKEEPDYKVERKLHSVAGEGGEVDVAVEHEAAKDKIFEYECYNDNVCLVDLDEEPPRDIDKEALKIALQISLLLNCDIIQDTQVMRKTVIDGSNVSGFQRTVLIGQDGYIETSKGKVGIMKVILEEDAARVIKKGKDKNVYRLDRLGIPMVEIVTEPDIDDKEMAKEAALKIGDILRACKVKRGIGTIRQDVNMSFSFGGEWSERIEMKGVQEPDLIINSIENEMKRQKKLVEKGDSVAEVRNALENGESEFMRPLPGAARMYPETDLKLLHISRDEINVVRKNLPKLRSEIKKELKKEGLSEEMISLVLQNNKVEEYKELLQLLGEPNFIAKMLVLWPKEIAKRLDKNVDEVDEKLHLDVFEEVINNIKKKQISEGDVKGILEKIVSGIPVEDAMKKEDVDNLEDEIMNIVKSKPGLTVKSYMGLVMKEFKGKVSGSEIMEILKKLVKE